jgi:hypothetical protein
MLYFCCNENRRELVRAHPTLNGIDFLEVVDDPALPNAERQRALLVSLLKPSQLGALTIDNIRFEGGERIRNVVAIDIAVDASNLLVLAVKVNQPGDFSTYTLRLVKSPSDATQPDGFDPLLSAVDFSFKVECPSDFDCAPDRDCTLEQPPQPEINYLAKDYASFRRLMLDRMAALMPAWSERNPADMGVALVELLAYVADHLSYQQDAIATEAYLGTARRRVSVRRHARLVDYHMHDGCNARAWVQVRLNVDAAPEAGVVIQTYDAVTKVRTRFLTKCIAGDLVDDAELPRVLAQFQPEVFELIASAVLYRELNELHFYTWGAQECCIPKGATRATLRDDPARRLRLRPGDVLIFEERLGPATGVDADADRTRRQAVRLTSVNPAASLVLDGQQEVDRTPGPLLQDPLTEQAIVEISWAADDALAFPLCISAITDEAHGQQLVEDVSVALGNIALADHGLTLAGEELGVVPPPLVFLAPSGAGGSCAPAEQTALPPRFRPQLHERPLTQAAPYDPAVASSVSAAMLWRVDSAIPEIELTSTLGPNIATWRPMRDLLGSAANAREFVVESESDLTATIRFGDDTHGLRPATGTGFSARYRVGNGAQGNVGADALAHLVVSSAVASAIDGVRNPLPARGGVEPERAEDVRQRAPSAFRTQERAVTPADYAAVVERRADIQQAAATFRWTGSWRTVFITADRAGGAGVDAAFEDDLRDYVEPFRMAGHDVEIDSPRPVPLEVTMRVCVKPEYFRSDVKAALLQVFSNRDLPDGRRGLFHPDNFTFGQTVYLSRLYAAAQAVDGVASVQITQFERKGQPAPQPLADGRLTFARLEIARLDNDPNFPERGVFHLIMEGGK